MNGDDLTTPTIVYPDRLITTALVAGKDRMRFGGPLELEFAGWPRRFPMPQRVLTIDLPHCDKKAIGVGAYQLPLVYGYELDGCRLKYEFPSALRKVKLLEIDGKLSNDWPYRDYPRMFPTVPISLRAAKKINWDALEEDEGWHGITAQDSRPDAGQALVIVPPNDAYGVSLWGHGGDDEGVQTIFRVDFTARTVEAWNECT